MKISFASLIVFIALNFQINASQKKPSDNSSSRGMTRSRAWSETDIQHKIGDQQSLEETLQAAKETLATERKNNLVADAKSRHAQEKLMQTDEDYLAVLTKAVRAKKLQKS